MSEAIGDETPEPTADRSGPELYVRVNLSKTSAGWRHETTVSMRWRDLMHPARDTGEPEGLWVRTADAWGTPIDQPARSALEDLLRMADTEARVEIVRREQLDAEKTAVPS